MEYTYKTSSKIKYWLQHYFSKSSENDDLSETLNYAVMSNSLMKEFDNERPLKILLKSTTMLNFIYKKYSSINENIGSQIDG